MAINRKKALRKYQNKKEIDTHKTSDDSGKTAFNFSFFLSFSRSDYQVQKLIEDEVFVELPKCLKSSVNIISSSLSSHSIEADNDKNIAISEVMADLDNSQHLIIMVRENCERVIESQSLNLPEELSWVNSREGFSYLEFSLFYFMSLNTSETIQLYFETEGLLQEFKSSIQEFWGISIQKGWKNYALDEADDRELVIHAQVLEPDFSDSKCGFFKDVSKIVCDTIVSSARIDPCLNGTKIPRGSTRCNKKEILKNAQKYTKKGQWDTAIEEYKKLIAENPRDRNLHNTVGDLYAKKGDNVKAIKEYKQAAKSFEEDIFIPQTIAIYQKILRIDNTRVEVHQILAQLYSDQGLTGDAIEQFRIAADHYTKKGLVKNALETYKQIADLDPGNLKVRMRLAELCNKENLQDQAVAEYLKIADILNKKGSMEESFHLLQKVIEIDETNLDAQKGLAKIYINKGVFDKAVNALEVILDQDQDNLQTLFLIGKAYFKAGSYDQAQAAFERILSIDPSKIGVRENLGRVYLQKGEFDNSLVQFEQVVDNFIQKKEYDLANNLLTRLTHFKPDHIRIRERIIEISEKLGNEDVVLEEFKAVADIYTENQEFEKALNIYDNLSKKFPTDAEIRSQRESIKAKIKTDIPEVVEEDLEASIEQEFDDISVDDLMEGVEVEVEDDEIEISEQMDELGMEEGEIDIDTEFDDANFENIPVEIGDDGLPNDVDLEIDADIIELSSGEDIDIDEADIEISEVDVEDVPIYEQSTPEVSLKNIDNDEEAVEAATVDIEGEEEQEPEDELTDEKIIEDHLYHYEVYIKYGMEDNAIKHLQSIVELKPDHLTGHLEMLSLYKNRGNKAKIIEELVKINDILETSGDSYTANMYCKELAQVDPDNPLVKDKLKYAEKNEDGVSENWLFGDETGESPSRPNRSNWVHVSCESSRPMPIKSSPPINIVDKKKDVSSSEVKPAPPIEPEVEVKANQAPEPIDEKSVKADKKGLSVGDIAEVTKNPVKKEKSKISSQSLNKLDSLAASILKQTKKVKSKKTAILSALESSATTKKKSEVTPSTPISLNHLAKPTKKMKVAPLKSEKAKAVKEQVVPEVDFSKELDEVDFYISERLFDDAQKIIDTVSQKAQHKVNIQEKLNILRARMDAQKAEVTLFKLIEDEVAHEETAPARLIVEERICYQYLDQTEVLYDKGIALPSPDITERVKKKDEKRQLLQFKEGACTIGAIQLPRFNEQNSNQHFEITTHVARSEFHVSVIDAQAGWQEKFNFPLPIWDRVNCSIYCPSEVIPGDWFLVQSFLHKLEQQLLVERDAKSFDPDATQRGSSSLLSKIARGTEVSLCLTIPGCDISEPLQKTVWQGSHTAVQYDVIIPETFNRKQCNGALTVSYDGHPVGQLRFVVKLNLDKQTTTAAESSPVTASRFEKFFVSYSSKDRPEVMKRLQMLRTMGQTFKQDLLHIEPGEEWEKKIYALIDASDAILLFWSTNAKNSQWVQAEWQYTIEKKGVTNIIPIVIEGPPIVPPPEELSSLHFNDNLLYYVSA